MAWVSVRSTLQLALLQSAGILATKFWTYQTRSAKMVAKVCWFLLAHGQRSYLARRRNGYRWSYDEQSGFTGVGWLSFPFDRGVAEDRCFALLYSPRSRSKRKAGGFFSVLGGAYKYSLAIQNLDALLRLKSCVSRRLATFLLG
jgi:hypothetical protein